MKTAMQQLIEWLEDPTIHENQNKDKCIKKSEQLLQAEKEHIMSAYHEGFFDGRRWSDKQLGANVDLFYKNGNDYFNKTFKSDE